jgi:hypothetical protein
MPLPGLALHYGDIERIAQVRGNAEFKELTFAVTLNIEGVVCGTNPRAISLAPTRRNLTHFDPGAHLGKPGFNRLRIHMFDLEDRPTQEAQPVRTAVPVGFE